MIGIPIALLLNNAGEWLLHKYVLHGLGKKKRSYWSFHWHEHHRESRLHGMVDPNYDRSPLGWNPQGKEALGLVMLGVVTLPLLPVAPFFTVTSLYCMVRYYRVHKKAHRDPEWAREHLPWHYDHHMGPNQQANWCVTHPWFDHVMGTRDPWVGTAREASSRKKHELADRPPGLQGAVRVADVVEAERGDGERADRAFAQ